jgi:TRAP-type C4-dicarboxylate transport system permease large subunit
MIVALKARHLLPPGAKVTWKERLTSLPGVFPIAVLFIVVIGGIYGGIVTPTEAAAVGALAAFIMALISLHRKNSTWGVIKEAFRETINITAMIFMLFIGAGIFGFFLAMSGVSFALEQAIVGSTLPPLGVLLLVCLLYIPLGMFLDPMSIMVITVPMVHPTLISLGYNGIWLGVIVIKLIEISLLTPPHLEDIFQGISLFLIAEVILLGIIIAFPELALWLPSRMK